MDDNFKISALLSEINKTNNELFFRRAEYSALKKIEESEDINQVEFLFYCKCGNVRVQHGRFAMDEKDMVAKILDILLEYNVKKGSNCRDKINALIEELKQC